MRYADFYECDICNGNSVGMSLFVQGCPIHCKGCFNPETWDFNGGKEWTDKTEEQFLNLVGRDYIRRVSFLGGEPLADGNVQTIFELIKKIRELYPDKQIWIYTGRKYENIIMSSDFDDYRKTCYRTILSADVIVDGAFEYNKRDLALAFRGSSNQRIIDIKKTTENYGEVILWDNKTD